MTSVQCNVYFRNYCYLKNIDEKSIHSNIRFKKTCNLMVISQIFEIFLLAAILFFDVVFGDFPVGKNCPTFDILLSTSISTKNDHKTFFGNFVGVRWYIDPSIWILLFLNINLLGVVHI